MRGPDRSPSLAGKKDPMCLQGSPGGGSGAFGLGQRPSLFQFQFSLLWTMRPCSASARSRAARVTKRPGGKPPCLVTNQTKCPMSTREHAWGMDIHQTFIRHSSDFHETFIRHSSDIHQGHWGHSSWRRCEQMVRFCEHELMYILV